MKPHVEMNHGHRVDDALVAILAVLLADERITIGGDWYRADEVKEMAEKIKASR